MISWGWVAFATQSLAISWFWRMDKPTVTNRVRWRQKTIFQSKAIIKLQFCVWDWYFSGARDEGGKDGYELVLRYAILEHKLSLLLIHFCVCCLFSCPQQQVTLSFTDWMTHWLTEGTFTVDLTYKERPKRPVTFEIFDQSDEETCVDSFDNSYTVGPFWQW